MKRRNLILLTILLTSLKTFGQTTTEIAKTGIKSTVSIVALDQFSQPLGYGSGFIIDDELVATNVHVIEGCNSAYILKNGESKKYKINGYVAIDRANDLVILKIPELLGDKLNLGNENLPEVGEKIFAVGNPKGFNGTFSEGNISGIRDIQTNKVLQITAPISPGSSGGPVLNSLGQVIGIAFASFSSGQNLNFAIPVKYLLNLKNKTTTVQSVSLVKSQPKINSTTNIAPNIKEGVTVRNIIIENRVSPNMLSSFSIKNNLPSKVSDIRLLFLVYDKTGTIVDYDERTYFVENPDTEGTKYPESIRGIKPFLARSIDASMPIYFGLYGVPPTNLYEGYKIKIRVLDFKIIED
jgi:hypothetical protein